MVRKTYRLLAAFVCVVMIFTGCTSARSQEETTQAPVMEYDYPDLDFSLNFPEAWTGRFTVERDEDVVTVSIDGVLTYSFTSVPNEEGAREEDRQLAEAGFVCAFENGESFFYYQLHEMLPEELYTAYRPSEGKEWRTKEAMSHFWVISQETEACSVVVDEYNWYLYMKTGEYINHRLGVAVTLPEVIANQGSVYVEPARDEGVIGLVLRDKAESEEWTDDYEMCYILAQPVSNPFTGLFNLVDSPELIFHDGRLYGVVNEWRPSWWRGVYAQFGWERYPEQIQNTFTFDQVQQVADSFRLLLPPDELEEALNLEQSEWEPYITKP